MSDGTDDELTTMANTPNKPRAVPASKSKLASTSNNNARAEAGPSRTSSNAQPSMKRKKATTVPKDDQDDDDVHIVATKKARKPSAQPGRKKQEHQIEVVEDDDDVEFHDKEAEEERGQEHESDEVENISPPVPKARKALSKKTAEINGHATAPQKEVTTKNKGKQRDKPDPLSKTKSSTRHNDAMDVDAVDGEEGDDANNPESEQPEQYGRIGKPVKSVKASKEYTVLQKENERLKERLKQSDKHVEDLKRQLEEFWRVRKTEAEELMERMEFQHQAEVQAKDALIKELTLRVSRAQEYQPGKNSAFEILTREEADKETQGLNQQIKSYKDTLRDKQKQLKQLDDQISALNDDNRVLRLQLDAEIERAKALAAQPRPPGSQPRPGLVANTSQDPKIATVIGFYEDLTNVIVPTMKSQPGKYLNTDEWILSCCYAHKDVVSGNSTPPKCLSFNMRLCYELKPSSEEPVTSMKQLTQSVHYIPLNLENESNEFVRSLGFLNDTFTFERDQLSLFLRTLYDYVNGEKSDEAAGSDDSVQLVE